MWEPDFSKKPPVLPLTPAEEQKRFWLPPGFKLEPVLTDPDIEEPITEPRRRPTRRST